ESWDFRINDGELPNVTITGFGTNSVTIENVPLGTYTVEELFGNANIVERCTLSNQEEILATVLAGPTLELTEPGGQITFVFQNQTCDIVLGTGTLVIEKVEDLNGNGQLDGGESYITWTVTIDGPDFSDGEEKVLAGGNRTFSGLATGTYTVTEATSPNYQVIGVRVNGGALVASTSADAEVV